LLNFWEGLNGSESGPITDWLAVWLAITLGKSPAILLKSQTCHAHLSLTAVNAAFSGLGKWKTFWGVGSDQVQPKCWRIPTWRVVKIREKTGS